MSGENYGKGDIIRRYNRATQLEGKRTHVNNHREVLLIHKNSGIWPVLGLWLPEVKRERERVRESER